MQGLLKVKDIRGGIPFLIVPPLYLFHLKEASLPSHFPPLIHHPVYIHPELALPSLTSLVPGSLLLCCWVFHPHSVLLVFEGCIPQYFYPITANASTAFPFPSFLILPLPQECLIGSETPNWNPLIKRADYAMNLNRPLLHA